MGTIKLGKRVASAVGVEVVDDEGGLTEVVWVMHSYTVTVVGW